jgi:dimethylamine--corrinoid protein Co-methyltransferase
MGSGDALGVRMVHMLASGMNGMRTAGDLVMRMQMTRGMRLREAKAYVADKLGVSVRDLSDGVVMQDVRSEFGIGRLTELENECVGEPTAMEAKFNIAELLDLPINCVQRFAERVPSVGAAWKRGGEVT